MKRIGHCASKKGSAQVEAAMVMPLVILAVVSTVYLLICIYSQVTMRSQIHLALRSAAGIHTNTIMKAGEEGHDGLYDSLLHPEATETLLEEQAEKRTEKIPRVGSTCLLKGEYGLVPIPTLELVFQTQYRGYGPFLPSLQPENVAAYYDIDEAQWIRNQDWIYERSSDEE